MNEFEKRFLRCESNDLFFTAGPAVLAEPYSSVEVDEFGSYSVDSIAESIWNIADTRLLRESEFERVWRWQGNESFIEAAVDEGKMGSTRVVLLCGRPLQMKG